MANPGAPQAGGSARDEAALVSRVKRGDMPAFETLIRPYESRLYRAILRITRDPTEAADVYQDTLLAAYEKLARFRGDAAFGSWLYRIGVNFALMRYRARKRMPIDFENELPRFTWSGMHARGVRDWADAADVPLRRAELRKALEAALDALPALERAIVWMKDVDGEDHETIAAATGLTVPATRSRLHRARLVLRERLAEFAGGSR